LRSGEFGQ